MRIIDRYGREWSTDPDPGPPGAFNKVYDAHGRLVSYWMEGPRIVQDDDEADAPDEGGVMRQRTAATAAESGGGE